MNSDETADAALGIGPQVVGQLTFDGQQTTTLWDAAKPMAEWTSAEWIAWLDYQLEQPQSVEAWKRLRLAQDVLRRWLMTAAQFQEWWQNNGD